MKHITKVVLLVVLVIFASCQKESTQEIESQQQAALRFDEKGMVVSDGEEDKELTFNEKSEDLVKPTLSNAKTWGNYGGGSNNGSSDCTPDLLETGFDTTVNIEVLDKPGANAYFDISIDGGDATSAFCSDRLPSLGADDDFIDFTVISSYDTAILAGGEFEAVYTNPQNFDKVNWILNNIEYGPGQEYTYGHVQYAIWKLIEGPFVNDFTDFLTPVPGDWRPAIDNAKGDEIYDDAVANGEGYTPECGGKLGLLLIPADFDNVQALLITKDLPEADECSDCVGDVNQITFKWDWHNDYRVRLYQRYENTCYAVKIFDDVVGLNDEMAVSGVNHDGTFGDWIYVYVGNCYYTKFKTNCYLNIGPGYKRGVVEVVSGTSTYGGELCEYEPPTYWCWWW